MFFHVFLIPPPRLLLYVEENEDTVRYYAMSSVNSGRQLLDAFLTAASYFFFNLIRSIINVIIYSYMVIYINSMRVKE